jgi:vacuolar protein-sorting-associated protein 4
MDGVGKQGRLLVLGATNLPWELDPAIRRRFERRIYIPLPDVDSRYWMFKKLFKDTPNSLSDDQFRDLA